ncbi:ABC transporter substrate-binding protein [Xylanimonas ulmi]|uniref:Carbohydrate ABC transporter substrate-binding protein (CUT1 family) n=1 Tax=Xylanimonas ulmi TaxID=228973 RepID=A0A4V2EY65_9MICO|nr:extracellular solute-binding protein [Xylanibacterium ulmi]RZS61910.1 carbohydrate ABC transporter substrate-binding protein (CUT1 family) [Xylanibacterium ulmi]
MKTKIRAGGIVAMAATVALVAAGCGGGDDNGNGAAADGGNVEITWWHNGTGEPLLGFWEDVAQEFMDDNPGVTINVQAFQNEELRNTVLPNAFAGGNAPDLFQSWGGGELSQWVSDGIVMDLSDVASDTIEAIGTPATAWQVDGKTYGLPFTFGPAGFWVNTDLWEQGGLDVNNFPTTWDELFAAWTTLKDAGITPVAVGGLDGWPAAHWWYHTAVSTVSAETFEKAMATGDFSDPAWEKTGENLQTILDANAFNDGWQATSAQQGAASSAGMVALGQAATELMGVWNGGVMGGIYNEANGLPEDSQELQESHLGWFPFPAFSDGEGDGRILGGGDGFSVHADAPAETVDFLEYILSEDVQRRYVALGNSPALAALGAEIDDPGQAAAQKALANASGVQLWLDTAFGPTVAGPMNDAIVQFMQGNGTPQQVVDAIAGAWPQS